MIRYGFGFSFVVALRYCSEMCFTSSKYSGKRLHRWFNGAWFSWKSGACTTHQYPLDGTCTPVIWRCYVFLRLVKLITSTIQTSMNPRMRAKTLKPRKYFHGITDIVDAQAIVRQKEEGPSKFFEEFDRIAIHAFVIPDLYHFFVVKTELNSLRPYALVLQAPVPCNLNFGYRARQRDVVMQGGGANVCRSCGKASRQVLELSAHLTRTWYMDI